MMVIETAEIRQSYVTQTVGAGEPLVTAALGETASFMGGTFFAVMGRPRRPERPRIPGSGEPGYLARRHLLNMTPDDLDGQ